VSRADYFERWASLHGGYDPAGSRLVGSWLSVVHVLARPFVRLRVPPDVVTLLGLLVAAGAAGAAAAGGAWVWVAVGVVVVSGVLDNIDGAVAVLSGRVTAWGHVLDSAVDRCCDALYLVALWAVGAPGVVCVAAGAVMGLAEYVRARAGVVGMAEVGVVTVFERPTRVIVTAAFLLGTAIYSGHAWAAAGAWVWLGLAVVGLVQLVVVVRRRLR
jgi:phosphatidylglycerophosphate synthase